MEGQEKHIMSAEDVAMTDYAENVENKEYNQSNPRIVGIDQDELIIPEAIIERPVVDVRGEKPAEAETAKQQKVKATHSTAAPVPSQSGQQPSVSPEAKYTVPEGTPDKSARKKAANLATMILNGWAQLKTLMYMGMNLEEAKLRSRAMKGKFDMEALYIRIPLGDNDHITVREFLDDYNANVREALSINPNTGKCELDPDFYSDNHARLTRIFAKRGLGMSDEASVIVDFTMDLVQTGTVLIGLRVSANSVLKGIGELYSQQKNSGTQATSAPTPPPPPPPAPTVQEPVYQSAPVVTEQVAAVDTVAANMALHRENHPGNEPLIPSMEKQPVAKRKGGRPRKQPVPVQVQETPPAYDNGQVMEFVDESGAQEL